jgi:PPOX class probable F420-dependent enzyme
MAVLHPDARALLESSAFGHLVTLNPDRSPQVTMIWVGMDGDEIVSAHLARHKKLDNVARDPRVALSVESTETDVATGMTAYLVVYGRARITEGGAPELLRRLAQTYLGPDATYPPSGAPPGYIVHITVERVAGVGPWARGGL